MSDGNPTPLALDGMGSFAGGRGHGHGHGHGHGDHLVRLVRNSEDRNPVGVQGGLLGDRSKAYDPTTFGGTVTLVYDEQRRRLVEDFVSLNGTAVNCAGGISYRRKYWLTGRRPSAARGPPIPPRAFPSRTATSSRPPWIAGRTARGRRADQGRGPLLARGRRGRPAHRHRLRDRGPGLRRRRGLLPLHPTQPRPPRRRRRARDAGDQGPAAGRLRRASAGRPLQVQWV